MLTHTRYVAMLEVQQLLSLLTGGRDVCVDGLVLVGHMDDVAAAMAAQLQEKARVGGGAEVRGAVVRESMLDGTGFGHFFGVLYELA
jgi:hypothetical protein